VTWIRFGPISTILKRSQSSDNSVALSQAVLSLVKIRLMYVSSLHNKVLLEDTVVSNSVSILWPKAAAHDPPTEATGSEDNDASIEECLFRLLGIWTALTHYLDRCKEGLEDQSPWQLNSTHNQLVAEIYDFELICTTSHRFDRVHPLGKTRVDVESDKSYWNPWLTMQVLYHSSQAILHHPLLLLSPKADRKSAKPLRFQRPPSFMQQSFDQATLHAGWVSRILAMWSEKGLVPADPFVSFLSGAVATVHFFLCFAKDDAVSEKALIDFNCNLRIVTSMCARWKHLSHTVSWIWLSYASY
jgi:hypothetical protein